jgi:hypothetical protein
MFMPISVVAAPTNRPIRTSTSDRIVSLPEKKPP